MLKLPQSSYKSSNSKGECDNLEVAKRLQNPEPVWLEEGGAWAGNDKCSKEQLERPEPKQVERSFKVGTMLVLS